MTSDKQKASNRANAAKSTGPRSAAGKKKSSQNALVHGLTSQKSLLPNEKAEEYAQFELAIRSHFGDGSAIRLALVDIVVSYLWRIRRIPNIEVALFAWVRHLEARTHDFVASDRIIVSAFDKIWPDAETKLTLEIGRMFETFFSSDYMNKFQRYEAGLQRDLRYALRELRELEDDH